VSIISALLDIENMGSVLISENDTNLSDIQSIVSMGLGAIIDSNDTDDKPTVLPLYEAINEDFDKLFKGNVSDYLLKKDISKYLLKLSLMLNDKNPEKEISSNDEIPDLNNMSINIITDVLSQIKYFPIQNVNLCGENIFKHPDFNNVVNKILNMNKGVILTINIGMNFEFDIFELNNNKSIKFEFVISDYSSLSNFNKVYRLTQASDNKFIFRIENNSDLKSVEDILSSNIIPNYNIQPVYNSRNKNFILSLLSPDLSDIFSRPIPLKEIYRNKRINSNTFGKLTINVDGSICSGFSQDKIGDIANLSIKECINKELSANSTWRVLRLQGKCRDCLLQYICPPVSENERYLDFSNDCGAFVE